MELPQSVEIKMSSIPNAGRGIFAKEPLNSNMLLGEYKGLWVSKQDFDRFSDEQRLKGFEYGWEICDYHGNKNRPKGTKLRDKQVIGYIDARNESDGNFLRLINHSDTEDNVAAYQIKDKIYYVTKKIIKPGEELLVNYGTSFFNI